AVHLSADGGLLATLSGQPRINAWLSAYLLAGALPGPVSDAPDNHRAILENKCEEYRRTTPLAIVNASDVNCPEDLATGSASCFIKMSEVSVEGLRQAFLDPVSRIRLASDPLPEQHAEFVAMAWQGGFLDGARVHLDENLNALIGGRGNGKSTV
ncbi:phosphoesterase, partial [bacterium]|nr:phosphoesterase [bacterium]